MNLQKHIARRFLSGDDDLAWEIVEHMHSDLFKGERSTLLMEDEETMGAVANTFHLLSIKDQKAYFVTNSVLALLDKLKVKKTFTAPVYEASVRDTEYIGHVETYDWRVFNTVSDRKVTFVFPDNTILRVVFSDVLLAFAHIKYDLISYEKNEGHMAWCMFNINRQTGAVNKHHLHPDVQTAEEFIYRLLCFVYLSDNEEVLVDAGHRHGTRKSGKLVNDLDVPLTIITSKWNITSIRTEGFEVSPHFRLQHYRDGVRVKFIDRYEKHGYIRRAKSDND